MSVGRGGGCQGRRLFGRLSDRFHGCQSHRSGRLGAGQVSTASDLGGAGPRAEQPRLPPPKP
jgi:hypothetical protein